MARVALLGGLGAFGVAGLVGALSDGNDVHVPAPDLTAARDAARRTIDAIDWSSDVLVVSVASTGWGLSRELVDAVQAEAAPRRSSVVSLRYPAAAIAMPESVAVGQAALEMVLAEIERRDPTGRRYHVALHGESQGAWVVNDMLARTPFTDTVDRVDLYGLPSTATHDDDLRSDPRVRITNHPLDPVAWPYLGPSAVAASAPGFLIGGNWADAPAGLLQVAFNPLHALAFLGGAIAQRIAGEAAANPHVYVEEYGRPAARHLLAGAER